MYAPNAAILSTAATFSGTDSGQFFASFKPNQPNRFLYPSARRGFFSQIWRVALLYIGFGRFLHRNRSILTSWTENHYRHTNDCLFSHVSRNHLFILCLYSMVLISSFRGLVSFSFLSITEYRKTFIFVKKKSNAFWKVKSATFIKAINLAMNGTSGQATWAYCAVFSLKIRPLDCSRAYLCIILYGNVQAVWSEGVEGW